MNIIKRPGAGTTAPATAWDPFRMFREMMSHDPFREIGWPTMGELSTASFNPTFEIKESAEGFTFRADVPGVKEEDVEVSMQGNRVTITGKRESEKTDEKDRFHIYERSFGSFARSFTLPDGVDPEKANASMKDGVLTLFLPKKPQSQPKKVPVTKT